MLFTPHDYQRNALSWLVQRTVLEGHAGGAYFMDPGLGKTVITLAWVKLLKQMGLARKTLVIAPLRVIYSVWPQETQKWDQFNDVRTKIVHGSAKMREQALAEDSDIYLTNPHNVAWLCEHLKKQKKGFPFQTIVVDESTLFKNWSAKRTRALRKMLPLFKYRLALTGTPSPNGLEDLFAQCFMIDLGESLGTGITKFRSRYFYRGGFGGYKHIPIQGAKERIEEKIQHMVLRLDEKDYLELPEMLINDIWVDIPPTEQAAYKKLERSLFLDLGDGKSLAPDNAGGKYMACKQFANGGIYDADKNGVDLHRAKTSAVEDIVAELNGKPTLIAFQYHHDLWRLRDIWPKIPSIDGDTSGKDANKLIDKWNAGELPLLAVQPQSLSHGVNLQSGPGRDVIWLGLTDNLEVYGQLNKRIHRQGVHGDVRIHRILARNTVDEAIAASLEDKDSNQRSLLDALNAYRKNQ